MKIKEVKIQVPEGYEIDKENSTFENIVFKEIDSKYSKTWEEFCGKNKIVESESYIDTSSNIGLSCSSFRGAQCDKNLIPFKFAEPMLALMQLLTIREREYTKGWEPDWNTGKGICCIAYNRTTFYIGAFYVCQHVLSFPSREMADIFYSNWKDLIEIAKPLL